MDPVHDTLCWFFQEGNCRYGDNCLYSHDTSKFQMPEVDSHVCKFWLVGSCRNGDECNFKHSIEEEPSTLVDYLVAPKGWATLSCPEDEEYEEDFPSLVSPKVYVPPELLNQKAEPRKVEWGPQKPQEVPLDEEYGEEPEVWGHTREIPQVISQFNSTVLESENRFRVGVPPRSREGFPYSIKELLLHFIIHPKYPHKLGVVRVVNSGFPERLKLNIVKQITDYFTIERSWIGTLRSLLLMGSPFY